jgi:hypothetical protein
LPSIPYLPFNLFAEVQLDLRLDAAHYSNKGNDPAQRLFNNDYTRAGSRLGFALTLDDPNYPSLTFVVAEIRSPSENTVMFGQMYPPPIVDILCANSQSLAFDLGSQRKRHQFQDTHSANW